MRETLTYVTTLGGWVIACPVGGGQIVALTPEAAKQGHEEEWLEGYGATLRLREQFEQVRAEVEAEVAAKPHIGLQEAAGLAEATQTQAEDPGAITHVLTRSEIAGLVCSAAGAASAPFMRDHPDYVMPSEEIGAGVRAVVQEQLGFDISEVPGYKGMAE